MKKRQIKEMMRDIDPKYQIKADARAASVQQSPHRSRIPAVLLGTAAAGCAAVAAVVILPKMNPDPLTPATVQESNVDSVIEEVSAVPAPITDFSDDEIRLMAPAYAPFILDIPADQQQALSAALTESEWIPYDMDAPFADGETYSLFVYNGGDSYSLISYADRTVVMEQNGGKTRWQISEDAERAIAEAANPDAEFPLTGHLTWCAVDTVNAADIWKNTRVGAKECDMTDKADIFFKMNNTADYFDRCSGVVKSGSAFDMVEYEFQVDLNTAQAYQHEENYNGPSAEVLMNGGDGIIDSQFSVTTALDGESCYVISDLSNDHCVKYYGVTHRIDSPTIPFEELHSTDPEGTEYDYWNSRHQLLSGISIDCIENYRMTVDFLQDFDKWEIVGTDQVNGRLCVQISGTPDLTFGEIERFELFVDEATGVTVRMLGYDANGTVIHFINVENLAFDDDAEPVKTLAPEIKAEATVIEPVMMDDEPVPDGGPVTESAEIPAADVPDVLPVIDEP